MPTDLRGGSLRGGGDPSALFGGDDTVPFLIGDLAAADAPAADGDGAAEETGVDLDLTPSSRCRGTFDVVGLE